MKILTSFFAFALVSAAASTSAHAQIYKLHNADVAVGGIGQYTTTLTSSGTNSQSATDSAGFLFTLRDHPVAWAGLEFNYAYTNFTEKYAFANGVAGRQTANVPTTAHEATAAYLIHPHFRKLQPFIGLGGGAIDFLPNAGPGYSQWRGAGLFEFGFDIPARKHMGFRMQGRALEYRAPNFGTPVISSQRWVVTAEPSLGAYVRW